MFRATIAALIILLTTQTQAAEPNFVAAWTASAQGPYPSGNATAQPELKYAFPDPAKGASDQTFRLIVRPDIWGKQTRIRLSNAFGTQPITVDALRVGLQQSGSTIVAATGATITFSGKPSVTIPPGKTALSDPATLPFVHNPNDKFLLGRKLAVTFHVEGDTGPMTWHAKALTTSYISPPHSGAKLYWTDFPYSTTSWYFLDELDMAAPANTKAIVAFGDSITDGTASTINGDDRWPDVFSRNLHTLDGNKFSVVNEGIGGNQIIGPTDYSATQPFSGGPAATERLQRDVLSLSGVKTVIWLEGINDFGSANATPEAVETGVRGIVKRLHAAGIKVFMATLTTSLNSTAPGYGTPETNTRRQAYNQFIRTAGIFDGVIDFETPTLDPATGELKAEYQPNSSTGGPGEKLHPNRAGYMAMGLAIDPKVITAP